jgi:uncharacterized protein YeaO (DUF488 family)
MIRLKRAREQSEPSDGVRYLVERLWPRGIRKAALPLNGWLKEVAPSTALRKWFAHDPSKWVEFQRRYFAELDENAPAWKPIAETARHGTVTLIYSSHDAEHNNALALKLYLEQQLL